MKKLTAFILAILIGILLTACTTPTPTPGSTPTPTPSPTAAPTAEPTPTPVPQTEDCLIEEYDSLYSWTKYRHRHTDILYAKQESQDADTGVITVLYISIQGEVAYYAQELGEVGGVMQYVFYTSEDPVKRPCTE